VPHDLKGVYNENAIRVSKVNGKTKQYIMIFAILALILYPIYFQTDPDVYIETPWMTFVGNGIIAIPLVLILYDWSKSRNK
jgi:uncharacterized membrane protein